MQKTIYLIPGVGADYRIFQNLEMPEGYEVVHLKWVKHKPEETLPSYVKRLLPQIKKDTTPILIGMSFGGIVAVELSKLVRTEKTIIISSIKHWGERPLKFGLLNTLRLHKFIPGALVARLDFWKQWALGKLTRQDKKMIEEMVEGIDIKFNEWAVDRVIRWKNKDVPENIVHIHGTKDTLFPHYYVDDAHIIEGGTHFMVVNRADEISDIIKRELSSGLHIKKIVHRQKRA